ncbi:MAG: N-acetyl-gamma-glutamyl-phosphate reductase [Rhizobiaceae bacterium]|nr:N-acetyl-gamma-glutamyl-phosphate reductase [Rhizobiaceae bacterium]
MQPTIFIDGEHGTTGLQIRQRLADRSDISVLSMPHEERRNLDKRREMLLAADIAILCLPDDASREAVQILLDASNDTTRLIDTSTAHRSHAGWVYGFAEFDTAQRAKIIDASRVSNPGCYSTGAIALIKPLVDVGILGADYPLTINAVSGYTGGGKQMIAKIEDADNAEHIAAVFFEYALTLEHKHVPEIVAHCGLVKRPIFTPSVGRFAQGMLVNVPLHLDALNNGAVSSVHSALADHYAGQDIVQVVSLEEAAWLARIEPEALTGQDIMKLYVTGSDVTGHVNLIAQLDNLGKGASGAAVQNLDLMLST